MSLTGRDLPDINFENELEGTHVLPFILFEMETAATPDPWIYAWSGLGDLVWNGNTYKGLAKLGNISDFGENTELTAEQLEVTLSGVTDSGMKLAVLNDVRVGMPILLRLGFFDNATGAMVSQPYPWYEGLVSTPTISEDRESMTVKILAQSTEADLGRPRLRRYTVEDQQLDDPTDTGFRYVPRLQDRTIIFGKS